ncbi:hypothetical protein SAMN04487911_10936 [Arenibacter nanhaiticus]|uniref:Uncharacterized protein n=1 Tax=Arenibacter nanhaiticus TaxID=558155 RepID=A0A1M6FPC4_9FLAO|nr:hypothetical protein [Arenibacter nanhaiticus]SHI99571.1 hypothetical protein SAMN04487911_10936 [Arenibacter nanhaiticus]
MTNIKAEIKSGDYFTFGVFLNLAIQDFTVYIGDSLIANKDGNVIEQDADNPNLYIVKLSSKFTNKLKGRYDARIATVTDERGRKISDTLFALDVASSGRYANESKVTDDISLYVDKGGNMIIQDFFSELKENEEEIIKIK